MDRRPFLLMLAILAALVAATLASQAQTPYPGFGDWVVDDYTLVEDTFFSIVSGNVTVTSNGHLVLRTVNISPIAVTIPRTVFTVEQGGTLEIYDCDIEYKENPFLFFLNGTTVINGTLIDGTDAIYIRCWNVSITNSTITNSNFGVDFHPMHGPYTGPFNFADNLVQDGLYRGLFADTGYYPGDRTRVVIVGNTVERISTYEGIGVSSTTAAGDADFIVEGNTVRTCGGGGITLQLFNKVLKLRAEGNDIEGVTGNALWLLLNASVFDFPGINGLRSVDNSGGGLVVFAWYTTSYLVGPAFRNLTIQSCGGGLQLSYVSKATLEDSFINDTRFEAIYATDSQLDVYRSTVDKGNADVNYATSWIRSWRTLDLAFKWLSGDPVQNRSIALRDGSHVLYEGETDGNGWMGNVTVMDWLLTTTEEQLYVEAKPYVIGTQSNVSGPAFALVQDWVADAYIMDNVPPVLDFGPYPPEGLKSTSTNVTITGTAFDDHSGLALVQVSIDPNPVWNEKVWHDATGTTSWEVLLTDLPDGAHQVYGRAFDRGNTPLGTVVQEVGPKVSVDTVPPTITITSPSELDNGIYRTNRLSVTVFGLVDGDVATLELDGAPVPLTSGTFSFPWGLSEGLNTVEVVATDGHGHVARKTLGVKVDVVPPAITISSPADGQLVNSRIISVVGSLFDEAQAVVLLVNQVPVSHEGVFSTMVLADSDGPFEITLTAEDDVGNIGTASVTVIIDTVPPRVVVLTEDGQLVNSDDQMIAVRITDAHDISLIVAGSGETFMTGPANGAEVSWALFCQEGLNDFEFICRDDAGNEARFILNMTLDTTPPTVVVDFPSDGHITNRSRLAITGTLADVASLEVGGVPVTGFTDVFTHEVDLVEGPNTITVTGTDLAGNSVEVIVNVALDSFPPWLSLHNLVDGRIEAKGKAFDLTGTTEPDATVTVEVGGVSHPVTLLADGSFSLPLTLVADETYVVVVARDLAGNEETREATVILPRPEDGSPGIIKPTTAAVVATGSTVVIIAAMASMEFTKYALTLLFLPLFARIRGKEVLDNKTRYALHGLIVENPGLHYNEIIREFGLTNGVAAYHLDVLEREGFLRSVRDGTMKRFFSTTTKVPTGFRATPEETREMMLDLVAASPGMSQKAIVDELGIGRTLVGYHLKNLVQEGYLHTTHRGRFTLYTPTKKRRNM